MKNKIIITTTNVVSGIEIEKYLGVINTNLVIGTNIFSDIGASFTDFFGGSSHSYQNKLEKMQEQAKEKLIQKLRELDGNVILGLSFDFDEISGKGKAMFMVSVSGTAVRAKFPQNININSNDKISFKTIKATIEINKIIVDVQKGKLITNEQWELIMENPKNSFSTFILNNYINHYNSGVGEQSDEGKNLLNYTTRYFMNIDISHSKNVLYDKLLDNSILTNIVIEKTKLFDAEKILGLIENGQINISVNLLKYDKPFYTKSDLVLMKKIILNLSEKDINNTQMESINNFKEKVEVLNELINK